MMRNYNKPALTYKQQVDKLSNRGLIINDKERAINVLSHINYYRLSSYCLQYQNNKTSHRFKNNTTFEQVISAYYFDQKLKMFALDAIEKIEISLRTKLAYYMGHAHGSHFHLQEKHFYNNQQYHELCKKLIYITENSNEAFIKHFRHSYKESLPPIWALVEIMTFGQLSKMYGNIKLRADRKAISKEYGLNEKLFNCLLQGLNTIRNISAHHSTLYSASKYNKLSIPKTSNILSITLKPNSTKIYNYLIILNYLVQKIEPSKNNIFEVKQLIKKYSIDTKQMGFPDDWQEIEIWKSS